MILSYAVLVGLVATCVRAWWGKRALQPFTIHQSRLVVIAALPQLFVFHQSATSVSFSDEVAAVILVGSQTLLLIFVYYNRRCPGMLFLGLGLALNWLVIVTNGGLMPISPETTTWLTGKTGSVANWIIGERLWTGKNIVLPMSSTHFWWLSDYFRLPAGIYPYRVAYSLGDVFIALGAFWLLWSRNDLEHSKPRFVLPILSRRLFF